MTQELISNWCIQQHVRTCYMYSEYLPYEFHLRMVVNVAKDFIDLYLDSTLSGINYNREKREYNREIIIRACWGHDLIEDCRVSYNDVFGHLGEEAADIIYAVSNEKGKTREERANDKYYAGIVKINAAVFVKLCDRIANVQYSKMTKSKMFTTYQKENAHFISKLGFGEAKHHSNQCLNI